MAARAIPVRQGSTNRRLAAPVVQIAWPARFPLQQRQHQSTHAAPVTQARYQEQVQPHVRIVTTANTKILQENPHALTV
jgi:hypothetical protein